VLRVLELLYDHLREQNYHVLRFNSRGVGRSTGWASFTGFNEGKDLEALVQWALQAAVKNVETLVLIVCPRLFSLILLVKFLQGYSHGSLITSLHPVLPHPIKTSHILLSYPLGARGLITLFRTNTYATKLRELVKHPDTRVLIIFGNNDEFTSEASYDLWVEGLVKDVDRKDSLKVVKVEGGSHFWSGETGREMGRAIESWLS
jgi:alpha/beta superfamily hydrolase